MSAVEGNDAAIVDAGADATARLLIPKPWELQSRCPSANPARRGAPRAVARTKKNPGGEPGLSLGRTLGVFTLPDSPAAGRKVSRLPSSLDAPALPLGSLPAGG